MKNTGKTPTKKLSLDKRTLRQLTSPDLVHAAGGMPPDSRNSCMDGCQYTFKYCGG